MLERSCLLLRLTEIRKYGIQQCLNLKKGVTFEGHGRYIFGEL